ncbi:hypothetical protein FPOA_09208 [Fusarium poae]|uniref:Uncharacterized protein n=1 Tax=Fusarium poae TaxID=36050 RepID=A0A1B8AQS7_FUSPO|nr:hypothetical protein FPOA_09208 [Fusarium poae]
MCPSNNAHKVCGKAISRLQQPRTRHTWGADCVLALERHIFRHRITPDCLFKRFAEDLLPALFLFEDTYQDRNIWQRIVRKAQDFLKNKVYAFVDQGVIVLSRDESGVSRYVFAQNNGRNSRGRSSQTPDQPVGEPTPRRNDNVRNLAGGEGAIAINGGQDTNVTLNYTTNVYGKNNGRRFRGVLGSDMDTDSDLATDVAMRAMPKTLNPTPAPSMSAPSMSAPSMSAASTSAASTSKSPAEQRATHPDLSTASFIRKRRPNSVSKWLKTNRPQSPTARSVISAPPTPPSWHQSIHSIDPADSVSVAIVGRALENDNDSDNVDDIGPRLRSLSLDQLYSALDALGETLVKLRVDVLRSPENADDIKESIDGHIKVLTSTQQELDGRFGIDGSGLSARRMWWLEC